MSCSYLRGYNNVSQLKKQLFRLKRLVIRTAKSQQIFPNLTHDFQKVDQNQKQVNQNQAKNKFGLPQNNRSEPKLQMNMINQRGYDFNCQRVQSMEFSCGQDSYRSGSQKSQTKKSSQNQIQQPKSGGRREARMKQQENDIHNKKNDTIKQDILNVLVTGSQDTGKTTFIRCFRKKQRKRDQPHIRTRTKQVKYQGGIVDENLLNPRNNVFFVDLPGYSSNQEDKYLREIQDYAKKQWKKYDKKSQEDTRIHCCLYFLSGPRIKQSDLRVMKKLSLMFNLIPIIAKSDHYTKEQITEIKEQFNKKTEKKLFYDIEQFVRLQYGSQQQSQILQSKFGKAPPFVISSSTQRQSNEVSGFVRKYPWGKLQIQNQQHTDFQRLCELLCNVIRKNLITKSFRIISRAQSQIFYERQQNGKQEFEGVAQGKVVGQNIQLKKEQNNTSNGSRFAIGTLFVAVVVAAFIFTQKNK